MYIFHSFIKSIKLIAVGAAASLVFGCAAPVFTVNVAQPEPSGLTYENASSETSSLSFDDSRPEGSVFSTGTLQFTLKENGQNVDEVQYLKDGVIAELNARGIQVSENSDAASAVKINSLQMKNHRTSAFSPLVTITSLSADVSTRNGDARIVSIIKRGKIPVWTITEAPIVENVFNQPLHLLVQDFASQINAVAYGYQAADEAVDTLIEEINASILEPEKVYQKVYQLGFSNNPRAVDALVGFAKSEHEYIRLAAISSLGLLKAEAHIDMLKGIYQTASLWQDRGMALKAIGNMGTAESTAFLQAEKQRLENTDNQKMEVEWNKQIIAMFI